MGSSLWMVSPLWPTSSTVTILLMEIHGIDGGQQHHMSGSGCGRHFRDGLDSGLIPALARMM